MATDDAVLTQEAVRRWHELVHELDDGDPGVARLRAIHYGGRRIMTVLRPALLTRPRYEAERLAVALVSRALKKVIAVAHREPTVLDELAIDAEERALVAIDPGFENIDVNDRFDGFISKRLGFLEVAGTCPGGVGWHDESTRAFLETSVGAAVAQEYELEPVFVLPELRKALVETWRDWGGSGDPTVAIVDWSDVPTTPEFELIREELRAGGLETVIVDPRELVFSNGRLRCGATTIDLVFRRLVMQDVLARPEEVRPLVDAARAGAVCMINPFAAEILAHKSVFELLTTSDHDFGLTEAERTAIENHVPWTRHLATETAPGAVSTVSCAWALEHRESVAIKPIHEYGGHGVRLGWETAEREWERVVTECADGDFVIQRRVTAHRERYPVDEPGRPLRTFYVDSDPYAFRGRVHGVLTRLSADGVTNVGAGGSFAPTFLIGPR